LLANPMRSIAVVLSFLALFMIGAAHTAMASPGSEQRASHTVASLAAQTAEDKPRPAAKSESKSVLDAILNLPVVKEHPAVAAVLVAIAFVAVVGPSIKKMFKERIWPFLVSYGGAIIAAVVASRSVSLGLDWFVLIVAILPASIGHLFTESVAVKVPPPLQIVVALVAGGVAWIAILGLLLMFAVSRL